MMRGIIAHDIFWIVVDIRNIWYVFSCFVDSLLNNSHQHRPGECDWLHRVVPDGWLWVAPGVRDPHWALLRGFPHFGHEERAQDICHFLQVTAMPAGSCMVWPEGLVGFRPLTPSSRKALGSNPNVHQCLPAGFLEQDDLHALKQTLFTRHISRGVNLLPNPVALKLWLYVCTTRPKPNTLIFNIMSYTCGFPVIYDWHL